MKSTHMIMRSNETRRTSTNTMTTARKKLPSPAAHAMPNTGHEVLCDISHRQPVGNTSLHRETKRGADTHTQQHTLYCINTSSRYSYMTRNSAHMTSTYSHYSLFFERLGWLWGNQMTTCKTCHLILCFVIVPSLRRFVGPTQNRPLFEIAC